jgi:Fic family protein
MFSISAMVPSTHSRPAILSDLESVSVNELPESIAAKKDRLHRLPPLSPEALRNLEHYYDVEITFTSNAIEGNSLTAVETTLVIEQGITIPGRPLKGMSDFPLKVAALV